MITQRKKIVKLFVNSFIKYLKKDLRYDRIKNMIKLITTDAYYSMFSVLTDNLKNPNGIGGEKNLVFCEEKASLMTERRICQRFSGSFNTEVYSFGKFLRVKSKREDILSKEGSSMAVRKMLSVADLKHLKSAKSGLAPSLFELIEMLKSAKVSPSSLKGATGEVGGVLKNKLDDVSEVYAIYEDFLSSSGFLDQGSFLTLLPDIIEHDEDVKNANVFIVGFTDGFTGQIEDVILSLLKTAKSVTAIFTKGDNEYAYLNESERRFKTICKKNGLSFTEEKAESGLFNESKVLANALFDPFVKIGEKFATDKIKTFTASSKREELIRVGEEIKRKVLSGARYKDFTIAIANSKEYADELAFVFGILDIPYFLDEKKKISVHPLVTLILSYCDLFRKNFKREYLIKFVKNPFVSENRDKAESFCDYIVKYNVDYDRIKKPFTFEKGEDGFKEKEEFRKKICAFFGEFDVKRLLEGLSVKEKAEEFSTVLKDAGFTEETAVNDQAYSFVSGILSEMERISYTPSDVNEFKDIFKSGIENAEISIIPQYNDAVFVGDFKETALARAKHLFVLGLNDGVPMIKEDVAILNESDMEKLEKLSLFLEPKISIVNRRAKESSLMCLCAFSEELYLSYSAFNEDGSFNRESEIIKTVKDLFTTGEFLNFDGYLSYKEGLYTFAKTINTYGDKNAEVIGNLNSFYSVAGKDADEITANGDGKRVVSIKNGDKLFRGEVSPTMLENYFKCPFVAFMDNGLKLKEKVKADMDFADIGTLSHAVFEKYMNSFSEVKDRTSSDALVDRIREEQFTDENYARYLNSARGRYLVNSLFREYKAFCFKNFEAYGDSDFKFYKAEARFNSFEEKNGGLAPISLCGGEIKLKGVIDRIDVFGDYCRIVDYKTGSRDLKDSTLFNGTKLQLYLYALAIKDKKIAGIYYMPMRDVFSLDAEEPSLTLGLTLKDDELLPHIDRVFAAGGKSKFISGKNDGRNRSLLKKEDLDARLEYARRVSELGAKEMLDGVMIASPSAGACDYCKYFSVCGGKGKVRRSITVQRKDFIKESLKGDDNE